MRLTRRRQTIRTEIELGLSVLSGMVPDIIPDPPEGTCPMCEATITSEQKLCDPCMKWSEAGCPFPIPPHICNTVARIMGFPETYR